MTQEELLGLFGTISLERMDSVSLMNRVDTKYLTSRERMLELLRKALQEGYLVLENPEGGRTTAYDSVYFDTPGRRMYLLHHARRLVRTKIRARTYLSSGLTFLEVKLKNNHGRTKKKRVRIDSASRWTDAEEFFFGKTGYRAADLSEALRTDFTRITLVNPELTERVTIDCDLCFEDLRGGAEFSLGNAVIIELKQDALRSSTMKALLLSCRIHPKRISKYCIGTALTVPGIKKNNFNEKIRILSKLI